MEKIEIEKIMSVKGLISACKISLANVNTTAEERKVIEAELIRCKQELSLLEKSKTI
jgi:hypothetical protein